MLFGPFVQLVWLRHTEERYFLELLRKNFVLNTITILQINIIFITDSMNYLPLQLLIFFLVIFRFIKYSLPFSNCIYFYIYFIKKNIVVIIFLDPDCMLFVYILWSVIFMTFVVELLILSKIYCRKCSSHVSKKSAVKENRKNKCTSNVKNKIYFRCNRLYHEFGSDYERLE